jgi:hypothetical protein
MKQDVLLAFTRIRLIIDLSNNNSFSNNLIVLDSDLSETVEKKHLL